MKSSETAPPPGARRTIAVGTIRRDGHAPAAPAPAVTA